MSSPPADRQLGAGRVLSHLTVMVALSAVLGLLVGGLAIPFAGALGIASKGATKGLDSLPAELKTTALPQKTVMLSAGGQPIATFYDENRSNVTLAQIAPVMRKAIIAIEDYRFYQHGALDLKGTLRAFVTNKTNAGSVQGGSSITQQMAKLTELQQAKTTAQRKAATADTYQRKILELRHAIAFEQQYSKDWILNRYLNIAYFGDGAYGIQAAARHYFSVDAKDLNLTQSAMLAGLVKNPVGFDPTNNPAAAKSRRDVVLNRMAQLNVVTAQEADASKAQNLGLQLSPTRNGCVSSQAAFFCDYALRYLEADPSLGKTVEDRKQLILAGGLTIKTTVDLRFNKQANAAVAAHVQPTDNAIGALAMVQPGTGNVKAIAQSRPMGRDKKNGQTYLNYVVPSNLGDSGGFAAGSTFKVFTLATALEQGMSPRETIRSPNSITLKQNTFEDCNGPYSNSGDYKVGNSTKSPPAPDMYSGTQDSVNTYYIQLEQRTGICEPYQLAKKMGVQLTNPDLERVPSFTLGVDSVSPVEMAEAYATVAARGMHCAAKPVTEILNSAGKVFKTYQPTCDRVMSEYTADTIADIMRGVMEGGFGNALQIDKPSAGKTGTIQDNKAVWFDGFTPALATVAMVAGANAEGTPITLNNQTVGGSYINTAFGSTVAGPIWGDAMKAIQDDLPDQDFTKPGSEPAAAGSTTVPSVVNMSLGQARQVLSSQGFVPVVGTAVDSARNAGVIAGQRPDGGFQVAAGSQVTVFPSNGSQVPRQKGPRKPRRPRGT
jgi:membrane peptidoglycan carboxypeptidase